MNSIKKHLRLTLLAALLLASPGIHALDRIYVLDTSGSMTIDGLANKVKGTLKEHVSRMAKGEHIIIMTFDEQVRIPINQTVDNNADIQNINAQINTFQFVGQWTWLSKTLDMLVAQVEQLRTQRPQQALRIYLMTDGIDEPPPESTAAPERFVDMLSAHARQIKMDNTHFHVLLYHGQNDDEYVLPVEESRALMQDMEGAMTVASLPRTAIPPIPPEGRMSYSGFAFDASGTAKGVITVEALEESAAGKTIDLTADNPFSSTASVTPASFELREPGQTQAVTIHMPEGQEKPRGNTLWLSSTGVLLSPALIPITAMASTPSKTDSSLLQNFGSSQSLLIPLAAVLVLALLTFLLLRRRPKEPSRLEKLDLMGAQLKTLNRQYESMKSLSSGISRWGAETEDDGRLKQVSTALNDANALLKTLHDITDLINESDIHRAEAAIQEVTQLMAETKPAENPALQRQLAERVAPLLSVAQESARNGWDIQDEKALRDLLTQMARLQNRLQHPNRAGGGYTDIEGEALRLLNELIEKRQTALTESAVPPHPGVIESLQTYLNNLVENTDVCRLVRAKELSQFFQASLRAGGMKDLKLAVIGDPVHITNFFSSVTIGGPEKPGETTLLQTDAPAPLWRLNLSREFKAYIVGIDSAKTDAPEWMDLLKIFHTVIVVIDDVRAPSVTEMIALFIALMSVPQQHIVVAQLRTGKGERNPPFLMRRIGNVVSGEPNTKNNVIRWINAAASSKA